MEIELEDLQKVKLDDDDVIVYRYSRTWAKTTEQIAQAGKFLEKAFYGHQIILIPKEDDLTIVNAQHACCCIGAPSRNCPQHGVTPE